MHLTYCDIRHASTKRFRFLPMSDYDGGACGEYYDFVGFLHCLKVFFLYWGGLSFVFYCGVYYPRRRGTWDPLANLFLVCLHFMFVSCFGSSKGIRRGETP
jgi:hypothetical protein